MLTHDEGAHGNADWRSLQNKKPMPVGFFPSARRAKLAPSRLAGLMQSDRALRMMPAIIEWCVGRRLSPGHGPLGNWRADKRQPYGKTM
jgi:hypothetical protein